MTESFYRNHMADFGDLVDITDMLITNISSELWRHILPRTFEETMERIEMVLLRLRENNLEEYYRRFIANFATISGPTNALLKGKGKSKKGKLRTKHNPLGIGAWDATFDNASEELKDKLTAAPVLGHPDIDFIKPYKSEIDASFNGLGAILSQRPRGW
ncbi:Hypothetical predicted protein [Mytilus galloprovincialis]|uniref:Reverse transcriptase/retrotransposon-derived protein RNase H-like domain-containing protein n=1 Tax=Mytilus galloprovincialis TaxID=29158 RepID=A0A8B6CE36_MYTGA|nr:Hypothetical predicted protein [Mytilus galloprovincialis]